MTRALLLLSLIFWTAPVLAGDLWDTLWRNDDQRGEMLMKQGKAAAAAKTYRDARRRAYAELQAGDYLNAAKDMAGLNDSNYNRGNALALAGKLQEAQAAYDAALARYPQDKDARHNRDLVAKALKQQQQSKPSSTNDHGKKATSGDETRHDRSLTPVPPLPEGEGYGSSLREFNNHDGKTGDKDADKKSGSGQGDQSESKSSGKPQQSAQNQSSAQNPTSGQNQTSGQTQSSDQKQAAGQNPVAGQNQKSGQGGESQPDAQAGKQSLAANPAQSATQAGQAKNAQSGTQAGQAKNAQSGTQAGQAKNTSSGEAAQAATDNRPGASLSVSEQQLAQDQWLRGISEDPGGLLRRKFMIEHLMRQQGGKP